MGGQLFGRIEQLGYVVDDLGAGVDRWITLLGVGPWLVFRNVRLAGRYRGEPTVVTMDVALGYQADMQIELIQPTSPAASPYRDEQARLRVGLHHVAWMVDDRDEAVARATGRGFDVVFEAETPGTRVAYLSQPGVAHPLYELIESASTRGLIRDGVSASRVWDGSHPVIEIDLSAA